MIDDLIVLLSGTRAISRNLLKGVDTNLVVFAESGWRVKDLIGHMTDWDVEAVRSLQAFLEGESYEISGYNSLHDYNHVRVKARWEQPTEELFAEWEANHETLKETVRAIPQDQESAMMRYPWRADGSVRWLVRVMAAHEEEHVDDIIQAVYEK